MKLLNTGAISFCLSLFLLKVNAQQPLVPMPNTLQKEFSIKDSLFKTPFIDVDEWREKPVRHRYVHGGFTGTETRFSFYFPEGKVYSGRFFQYITPFPDNEFLSLGISGEEDKISFSLKHGAYFIETNGGGKVDFAKPSFQSDPSIGAYRANAACAAFSRIVAQHLFGGKRPYGYAFGGSGGAYRTIGSIENTEAVWDGVVPYVLGSPMAIPNVFSVRMNAMRILHKKFPAIIDAMDAGGSGNMYEGLNEEEKEALSEATALGFPPQSWFGYKTMGIHGFVALYQGMKMIDGKYFEDFWKEKGYLGANPTASLVRSRIQQKSKIKKGITIDEAIALKLKEAEAAGERGSADLAWKSMGGVSGTMPVGFQLEDLLPDVNFMGGDLIIRSGDAKGSTLQLSKVEGDKVVLGPADLAVLVKIKAGDEVFVDNSAFLAVQTYHRHQVPGKEYKVWDYFRDKNGQPLYPQRPLLIGPLFTRGAAGVLPTGKFSGKMILLCSLWDREAFAWQGDFYRQMVRTHLGDREADQFRLWYTDHALHGDQTIQEDPTRTISYLGVLQQALLDLSDWVERGVVPASNTQYRIEGGQVLVPEKAKDRKGLQPVVSVKAKGSKKALVKSMESVSFTADIDWPENTGSLVNVEWDFDGTGNYAVKDKNIQQQKGRNTVRITRSHAFSKTGTYFVTVRVTTQRKGDKATPFTRIYNLDRVRVVVK